MKRISTHLQIVLVGFLGGLSSLMYAFHANWNDTALVQPGRSTKRLSNLRYKAASVLPVFSRYDKAEGKKVDYVILTREGWGKDKGTYDDFGGSRDRGENHPIITAAREFWEEAFKTPVLHMNEAQAREYIDILSGHTEYVIANSRAGHGASMVTYITRFNRDFIRPFKQRFAKEAAKGHREKDRIATVRLDTLVSAIVNHQSTVSAFVMDKDGNQHKEQIRLRPIFASKLRPFFANRIYKINDRGDKRIRFY